MNAPVTDINIGVSFDNALALAMMAGEQAQEVMRQASRAFAEDAKALWEDEAEHSNARFSGAYIAGITAAVIEEVGTDSPDGFTLRFEITNRAPHAEIVENGHAAFHLPSRINWSGPKVKWGKKGPYLHVPFRHYTKADTQRQGATMHAVRHQMPPSIERLARDLAPTMRTNSGAQYDALGRYRAADRYIWGGRMNVTSQAQFIGRRKQYENRRAARTVGHDAHGNPLTNPEWQTSKFHGLFKSQPSRGSHTEYMTIRTITPNSKGWNIPALPGHGILRKVEGVLNSTVGQDRFNALIRGFIQQLAP